MKILGIDPGFDRLGVAVVEGTASKPILIMSECVRPPKGEAEERLAFVADTVRVLLVTHKPDACAIEGLFFSTNKKTALKVAEARGAILSILGEANVPVREYAPGTIKLAITGNGRADKTAIARMIPLLVSLPKKQRLDDELDAIAIALTGLTHGYPQG